MRIRVRTVSQTISASPALMVVAQLIGCGLPHIDVGASRQMIRADLGHGFPHCVLPIRVRRAPLPTVVEP